MTNLYVALSGGGFRASVFHLGALRCLLDYGQLQNVKAISSVSGGSITAAHVVAYWDEYSRSTAEFVKRQGDLQKLVRFGLRERLVRRIPLYWVGRKSRCCNRTVTDRLAQYYSEFLFKERNTLDEFARMKKNHNAPRAILMTTNLTRHSAHSYFDVSEYVVSDDGGTNRVSVDSFPISEAVAASSAFPFLFPPLELNPRRPEICALTKEFGGKAHYLTDGGVFENLGITVLREIAKADPEPHHILVFDAGKRADWDLQKQSYLRALVRSSEVMQYWSERRLDCGKKAEETVVPIDSKLVSDVPRNRVEAAAQLRTDFDAFSDLEWQCLFDVGYSAAESHLKPSKDRPGIIQSVDVEKPHAPWQSPIYTKLRQGQVDKQLAAGQNRTWRPWRALDSISALYALTMVAVFFAFWFEIPKLFLVVENGVVCILKWSRPNFPADHISFSRAYLATPNELQLPPDLPLTDDARRAIKSLAEAYSQEFRSADFKNSAPILFVQEGLFEKDFRTIDEMHLRFDGNAKATGGEGWLIDTNARPTDPGYRAVHLPRKPGMGDTLAETISIERPKEGERLVLFLRVAVRDEDPRASPFPGRNVDDYGFYLEER